jgi:hypothetical protein
MAVPPGGGWTLASHSCPGTPLHTNASENDLRSLVKRKISGGTMSAMVVWRATPCSG